MWLGGLKRVISLERPLISAHSTSMRCYCSEEIEKIDISCRRFLYFLENAGVLDALTREMVIERAMAVNDTVLSLSRLKVIVLMVLWSDQQDLDILVLGELLVEDSPREFH